MFDFPIHSPIQEITFNVPDGYHLYIKRDDLIDPIISGNKWRKLKYHLEEASHQHKKILVSFGGAYSNHLLALASASAKFGFQSFAFVRGDELQKPSETLLICELFGMKIIRVSREDYKQKQKLFEHHFGSNEEAYFIDEGGYSAQGAKGCEELVDELDTEYQHLFLAAGTGCTTAGIINAIHKKQMDTHVHSVVVHNGMEEVKENIVRCLGTPYPVSNTKYSLLDTPEFGRYAKHTDELLEFCLQFQKNTGILLDPVYTGKAMYKCYEWMNNHKNVINSKILFIHTGGLLGNLGKQEAYKELIMKNTL